MKLDRESMSLAADLETVYEVSLRQLLANLFDWGTPLAQQNGLLQIMTTVPALLDLAQIKPTVSIVADREVLHA